jgi:hypothetical protein
MANLNLSQFTEKLFVADADHTFIWDTAASISKRVSRNSWLNSGTLTSDAPVTISQTWDAGSNVMTALKVVATDTASGTASNLLELWAGGTPALKFNVDKSGSLGLINSTAAASGVQQISPSLDLVGQGWKSQSVAESQEVRARINLLPVQGTSAPTGSLQFQFGINGATPTTVGSITSAGALSINSSLTSGGYYSSNSAIFIRAAGGGGNADTNGIQLSSLNRFGWGSGLAGSTGSSLTLDTVLVRDAANTLALRNGALAQTFNVYGTYTSGTSYERLTLSAPSAANAIIGTNKGSGGGTARGLDLQTDGVSRWSISTAGHLLAQESPSIDIGAQDSNKPRNVFCGTSFRAPYAYVQYGSGSDQGIYFSTNSTSGTWAYLGARSSGVLTLSNGDITDFNRLQLGGTTNTFPAIARDGAGIKFTGAAAGSTSWIKVPPVAVSALPLAATAGAGARAFVNDASAPVFGTAVTGGGAVLVPVYSDGSAWNVG